MKLPVSSKQPEQHLRLLESPPPLQTTRDSVPGGQSALIKWLPTFALLFLTFNAVDSAIRSRHRPSALAFVAFVYGDLVLLFACLRRFERSQSDISPAERGRLKASIWALATALNLAFAWRVARVVPPALGVVVWLMSGAVIAGGFYGLFVFRDAVDGDDSAVGFVVSGVPRKEGEGAEDNV